MSQVMIPDVSQPICLEQLRKTLSNIVGLNQITHLVYANITDVVLDVQDFVDLEDESVLPADEAWMNSAFLIHININRNIRFSALSVIHNQPPFIKKLLKEPLIDSAAHLRHIFSRLHLAEKLDVPPVHLAFFAIADEKICTESVPPH